ncbi:hypothetical protein NCCP2331_13980 [Sporosarcina sp. NCCP-2331]|nr:hypothetical protein NCCP2331_13980 [Sporosarcina sp. NCCP-2331]GLB55369.1 hypothetical protein NCCP2378_11560 [Sporosarcina sp. NCCP-2378]
MRLTEARVLEDNSYPSKHTKTFDSPIMKRVLEVIIGKSNRYTHKKLKVPKSLLFTNFTTNLFTLGPASLRTARNQDARQFYERHGNAC